MLCSYYVLPGSELWQHMEDFMGESLFVILSIPMTCLFFMIGGQVALYYSSTLATFFYSAAFWHF